MVPFRRSLTPRAVVFPLAGARGSRSTLCPHPGLSCLATDPALKLQPRRFRRTRNLPSGGRGSSDGPPDRRVYVTRPPIKPAGPASATPAAPLDRIHAARLGPDPRALSLATGQSEVCGRFERGGLARSIILQGVVFAGVCGGKNGDKVRAMLVLLVFRSRWRAPQSPPPEGGGDREAIGGGSAAGSLRSSPTGLRPPPPSGGGLVAAIPPPSRRREPALHLTARRSPVWTGCSADTGLRPAAPRRPGGPSLTNLSRPARSASMR